MKNIYEQAHIIKGYLMASKAPLEIQDGIDIIIKSVKAKPIRKPGFLRAILHARRNRVIFDQSLIEGMEDLLEKYNVPSAPAIVTPPAFIESSKQMREILRRILQKDPEKLAERLEDIKNCAPEISCKDIAHEALTRWATTPPVRAEATKVTEREQSVKNDTQIPQKLPSGNNSPDLDSESDDCDDEFVTDINVVSKSQAIELNENHTKEAQRLDKRKQPMSEETKAKIRAAQAEHWKKRRESSGQSIPQIPASNEKVNPSITKVKPPEHKVIPEPEENNDYAGERLDGLLLKADLPDVTKMLRNGLPEIRVARHYGVTLKELQEYLKDHKAQPQGNF